jgi:Peptidase A4 family
MKSHRLRSLAACLPVLCLPALGLLVAASPAAGASTVLQASHSASTKHSARAEAIARDAIRHLAIGQHSPGRVVSEHLGRLSNQTTVTSTNWAGYADIDETYTKVTGKWTEPTVTCSGSATKLAAFWVGLDGYSSDSVEQDGTLAECYEGTLYSYTWWEMYPTNDIQVVGGSVAAGDAISASVVRTGTSYALKVTDSTRTANSFSTTQTCSSACANSSAEWIAEAPSSSTGIYPLAPFTSWTLTNATVATATVSGVISTFPYAKIGMVNSSGSAICTTGALNSAGNGFTVTC